MLVQMTRWSSCSVRWWIKLAEALYGCQAEELKWEVIVVELN